jgi:predicted glycosyltransferase
VRLWVDIDNPPQARYLLPLARRFEEAGHDVLVTARAYGDTLAILESEGERFEPIGSSFGKGIPRKLHGLWARSRQLVEFVRRQPTIDLVLTGSRSATLGARRLGIPSFVIIDYEYVDLLVYGLSGSHIVFPDVIDPVVFRRRGIRKGRLLPFEGLKEDISFADVDFSSVAPHDFGDRNGGAPRILFRPPAEESHYYRRESRDLALELLRYLATKGARIVFSPRSDLQIRYLEDVPGWREEPIVLRRPIPFVSLLKGVDGVVSAGGTMLREAAYLGVPAYSVFRSRIGTVDRYLASLDRLSIIRSSADFSHVELSPRGSIVPLRQEPHAVDDLVHSITERLSSSRR